MPKLTQGGVNLSLLKSTSCFGFKMGNDYSPEEAPEAMQDGLDAARSEKKRLSLFAPGTKEKQVMIDITGPDGKTRKVGDGYSVAAVDRMIEEGREPVLMLSFSKGFPAPYLALFMPGEKAKRAGPTAKPRKYARKA